MKKMKLWINKEGDGGYLYFRTHPQTVQQGLVKKQIRLRDVIESYQGPDIYVDFDDSGVVVGLEMLE